MEKHTFTITNLTATKFTKVEDKAKWLNDLAGFVRSGFSRARFTKPLYNRLSMCFGHIAHYSQGGFYETWFDELADRLSWIEHTLDCQCHGDPSYTFSDAERLFQIWLQSVEGQAIIQHILKEAEQEVRGKAMLAARQNLAKLSESDRCAILESLI